MGHSRSVPPAVREENVELAAARRLGVPVLHRAQVLAQLMMPRTGGILVTGTHGKTTVSAMLAHILCQTGGDPSFVIGADISGPATGGHAGSGEYFVAEADESDRSFRWLRAGLAVVTSIEDDHPEQYPTASACADQVTAWLRDMPAGGIVVANADDPLVMVATDVPDVQRVTYGEATHADVRILRVDVYGGTSRTTAWLPDGQSVEIGLSMPGRIMAHNAVAALTAAVSIGVDPSAAVSALASYRPVCRRLTVHGEVGGVTVMDSFAHHPSAIAADIEALAGIAGPDGRVLVVFQPSGYRRTRTLGERMGAALAVADQVVLLPIVDSCNSALTGVTALAIGDVITDRHGLVAMAADLGKALATVVTEARPGDVVVTMGTGDVTNLGAQLLARLSSVPLATAELAGHR